MNTYLLLVTLLCAIISCMAKPDGAPLSACSSLLPIHRDSNGVHSPRQDDPPYTVSVDKIGKGKVRVTISSPTNEEIRGFMLQARSANDRNKFIAGEFTNSQVSKGIDCHGQKQSTLTHVNPDVKAQVTTEWTGTAINEDIIFRATVAKSYDSFWEKIDSEPVKVRTDEDTSTDGNSDAQSIYDDCSKSKGCVGLPEKCIGMSDCRVLLTYEKNPDGIQFEMYGSLEESEYMAMGLSGDRTMGDDFVTECLRFGSEARLQNSWNEGRSNTRTRELPWEHSYSVVDRLTKCVWTQPNTTTFHDRTYDLAKDKYYVLLAKGPVENGKIRYHRSRVSSQEPVNFFGTTKIHVDSTTESTGHSKEMNTTSGNSQNSSSQLSSSLFWVVFFGVFYAGGKNVLKGLI